MIQAFHPFIPELRGLGTTRAEAVVDLLQRLKIASDSAQEGFHRSGVQRVLDDVRKMLDGAGALETSPQGFERT